MFHKQRTAIGLDGSVRKNLLVFSLSALFGFIPVDRVSAQEGLTIEEAVRLVLTRNERADIAEERLAAAAARVNRARASFFPDITASAGYTRRGFENGGDSGFNQNPNAFSRLIALNLSLFDARAFPLYRRAKLEHGAARLSTEEEKRLLTFEAADAFLRTLGVEQVQAEEVERRRVEYQVTAVGSVEAFETVQVTARVAGVIERVHFAEGETVKADKVLAEIEPDRFRLAVESARAALTKAEAAKADAEAALARREAVNEKNPGLIIGEEIETFRTRVQTASAELSQARAALEIAELNLRDAFTKAPVVGIIQTRTVQTGEYVQPGKVLATLIRREPLLLRFRVPEQDSAELRPGMSARFTVRGGQRAYSAVLTHVAGSADPASRMVAVTAEVNDPNRKELRPGTFAEVRVPLEVSAETPVIPQTAIRPSERGFLAFVVEEGIARERVLTLGMRTADGLVEVRSGVQPGEVLVVRGGEALREGAQVRIAGEQDGSPFGGSAPGAEPRGAAPADPNRGGPQR